MNYACFVSRGVRSSSLSLVRSIGMLLGVWLLFATLADAQELWGTGKREDGRFRFGATPMGGSQFRFRTRRSVPDFYPRSSLTQDQQSRAENIMENIFDFLRDVTGHSPDTEMVRGKKSPDDSSASIFPEDAETAALDPGFVQARPAREGRRYLLWRKITG